jgi:hypothetical protein
MAINSQSNRETKTSSAARLTEAGDERPLIPHHGNYNEKPYMHNQTRVVVSNEKDTNPREELCIH